MTAVEVIFLLAGGMSLFDSLVHSFGTAGTGGFGIKADSIGGYSPYIQWVITIFMFLFGINFNLYYLILIKKFKSAVTDSDMEIAFREGKDGINNLLTIYSAVTGKTIAEAEKEFAGQGYGTFKQAVGEAVASHLKPIRETYNDLLNNKDYLEKIYKGSAEQASAIAERTLRKVYKKIGFIAG